MDKVNLKQWISELEIISKLPSVDLGAIDRIPMKYLVYFKVLSNPLGPIWDLFFFKAQAIVDARMISTSIYFYSSLTFNSYQKFVYALRAKGSQRQ